MPGILPSLADRDICERCGIYPAVPDSRLCLTCRNEAACDEDGM